MPHIPRCLPVVRQRNLSRADAFPQHMEDTGQLHYSTAVLADTSVAAPKSHVPGAAMLSAAFALSAASNKQRLQRAGPTLMLIPPFPAPPGPVNLLPQNKPGASMLVQRVRALPDAASSRARTISLVCGLKGLRSGRGGRVTGLVERAARSPSSSPQAIKAKYGDDAFTPQARRTPHKLNAAHAI